MLYAKVLNNANNSTQSFQIGPLSSLFPDTTFPVTGPSTNWLILNKVYPVVDNLQANTEIQQVVKVAPYLSGGVVMTANVVNLTANQISQIASNKANTQWDIVRTKRNQLISASDWVVLPDANVESTGANSASWLAYRQELRTLPQTQTDPFNIVWPAIPGQPVANTTINLGSAHGAALRANANT